MKKTLLFVLMLFSLLSLAQENTSNYRTKRFAVKDSITIDSVSINPSKFVVKTKDGTLIDSTLYTIDYAKAILKFRQPIALDTLEIEYLRYPQFLTKVYKQIDEKVIVDRSSSGSEVLSAVLCSWHIASMSSWEGNFTCTATESIKAKAEATNILAVSIFALAV